MSHTITNLSHRPVSIRLNTGVTRHLPPRACLSQIAGGEIEGNARIEKLTRQRVIAVSESAGGPRSRDMSAAEAVEHIRGSAARDLAGFTDGEDRVSVLRALEEKQGSKSNG